MVCFGARVSACALRERQKWQVQPLLLEAVSLNNIMFSVILSTTQETSLYWWKKYLHPSL